MGNDRIIAMLSITGLALAWLFVSSDTRIIDLAIGAIAGMATGHGGGNG